jgi:predicted nucleic acid-binding protein
MSKLRLYLDNCCFNRPFDNQEQWKIYLETQAKLAVQEQILLGHHELIWSYILEYENAQHPIAEIQNEIVLWRNYATVVIEESESVIEQAQEVMRLGIHLKDALHIACALSAQSDCFMTTDRKLLNKLSAIGSLKAMSPIAFVEEYDL